MLRRGIVLATVILCALLVWMLSRRHARELIVAISLSPDASKIAVGMKSGNVEVLSLHDGKLTSDLQMNGCSGKWLNAVTFVDDHVACSGEELREFSRDRASKTYVVAESGGAFGSIVRVGENFAVITAREQILLLDRSSGQRKRALDDHTALYGDLRTSKDGKWLAASGHTVHVWAIDGSDAKDRRELAHSYYTFGPIAFGPERMYVGSQDGCVYVWTISGWRELPRVCLKQGAVSGLDVNHDGSLLIAAAGRVSIVQLSDNTTIANIAQHSEGGLAFLPDGGILLAHGRSVERWHCMGDKCTVETAWHAKP